MAQSRKVERTQDAPLATVPLTAEERRSRSLWLPNETDTGRIGLDDFDREDPVVYEPRALWNVFSIDTSDSPARVPEGREEAELRNGSRHTMVLTHMTLCPIGYTFRELIGLTPTSLTTWRNAMSVLSRINFFVSAPFRQHLSKDDILAYAVSPEPNGDPSFRQDVDARRHRSSTFGLSRWQFDVPYWLPRQGSIQFDLSTVAQPNVASTQLTAPHAAIALDEEWGAGGRFTRHARFSDRERMSFADVSSGAVWPAGGQPTPVDAHGTLQSGSPTRNVWDSVNFTADEFRRQQASRGADRSWFRGFSVMIDQIDWDDGIDTAGIVGAGTQNQPIAPLSTRVITRARSRNGGSGQWWWAPGAPLCLVSPTMGPGLTFQLPKPIVLAGLGDSLRLELQAPTDTLTVQQQGEVTLEPTYNIGASFTGYAMIEG